MDKPPVRRLSHGPEADGPNLVTREMVRSRTHELVLLAGREPAEVKHRDYAQARQELTGESDFDRQEARMDWSEETPEIRPAAQTAHAIGLHPMAETDPNP